MSNTRKLKTVANIVVSNVDKKSKETEKTVYLCNYVDVYHHWAITSEMQERMMVATANDSQIESYSIKKGQVAITKDSETRDDIGISTYIADSFENVVLGYHCALITPNASILDGAFLNVVLHSEYAKRYFEANSTGSGQRYTISEDTIGDFPIPLPPLEEQKKIASLFSGIDRKIQNNKQLLLLAHKLAKLVYEYWFMQYDFPNADKKPYKSSGGLMVWNERLKREIPSGWTVERVGNLLGPFPRTESVLRENYNDGRKYPIVDQSPKYICGYTDEESVLLRVTDAIVFGDHTNIAKYVNFHFARGADGTQIICSNNPALPNFLLYLQIESLPVIEKGYSRHFKFLKEQYVVIPDKTVSDNYLKAIDQLLNNNKLLIQENHELEQLRDYLIPLIVNEQVTFVPDSMC